MDKILGSLRNRVGSRQGMMLVCLALVGGTVFLLWNGTISLEGGGAWIALLPMLLCVGMHALMHGGMGHGGHEGRREDGTTGHAGHACCMGHRDKAGPTEETESAGKPSPTRRVTHQAD